MEDLFIETYSKYMNNNLKLTKNSIQILKNLIIEINENKNIVDKITIKKERKRNKPLDETNEEYFPTNIKKYINENSNFVDVYKCNSDVFENLTFYFVHMKDSNYNEQFINFYLKRMITWLYLLRNNSSKKCVKSLDCWIYLTPFKKECPMNGDIFNALNVNSAYTYRCIEDSLLVIYRVEDLFNRFIHETFHTFGLDFENSYEDEIKKMFQIENSKINLFESYCETWARILNIIFVGIELEESKNINNIILNIEFLLYNEIGFSLFQKYKILKYMNISYLDLLSNTNKKHMWKEKTNVFSYYIITSILLTNINDFLNFNSNKELLLQFDNIGDGIYKYLNLIKKNYKNKDYFNKLKMIEKVFQYITKNNSNKLLKTCKMTLFDL